MAVAFSKIQSQFQSLYEWCFRPDKNDKKHKGWKHPIFSLLLMSLSCLMTCSYLASYFVGKRPNLAKEIPLILRTRWGYFLLGYWMTMLCSRLTTQKSRAFYDMLWACNISILLAIFGLARNSPVLIGTSLITIACDQLLWYADILSYVVTGKFHIGVAKYLIWPETTISTKLTSTHHLWFIPLLVSVLKKAGGLKKESFKISLALTLMLWVVSRSLLPKTLPGPKEGAHDTYMNVNLSWELWKDVPIDFVNKLLKDESYWKTLATNGVTWNGLNYVAFLLLRKFVN